MNNYIKTKGFSKLTGVSVRTLQYYDEIGVLKPAYINEHGHRFYDSESFSMMFVILSLKSIGMNLNGIKQYISESNFDIQAFIEEEKRRVETEITDLQLRLTRLSELNEKMKEGQDISSAILPFFSHITNSNGFSQTRKDRFLKNEDNKPAFNIQEWNVFIKNLNFCFERQLPVTDKRAVKCVLYWKNTVLEANQINNAMAKQTEIFYQKNPGNTFGLTEHTYKYLIKLMGEYDKK